MFNFTCVKTTFISRDMIISKKEIIEILLAGGQGSRLGGLTREKRIFSNMDNLSHKFIGANAVKIIAQDTQ